MTPPGTPPATPSATARFEAEARKLVLARYSLVLIETYEESRLRRLLTQFSKTAFKKPVSLITWSVTTGLVSDSGESIEGTKDPIAALSHVAKHPQVALFLFRDLHRYYDNARVVRALRDIGNAIRSGYKTIFMSSPAVDLPPELTKEVALLDLNPPDLADMGRLLDEAIKGNKSVQVNLGDKRSALLRAALGMTELEAKAAFAKLFVGRKTLGPEAVEDLYEEKRTIVRRDGILEFVPPTIKLEDIGGLGTLKSWLKQRLKFFSAEAEAFGLRPPKGMLVTGISGCGKSLVVKAVSTYWQMPLVRLDMNRIYAGVGGSPERALELAIRSAESVSPCVLWIDEIETGLTGGSSQVRVFTSFLTWMQEKQSVVFVAATANEIDKLPAELLRKGRFDEIFFVDLPNEKEREEIFRVHLLKRKQNLRQFDLELLAQGSDGFNGAEIEEAILAAMYRVFDEGRQLSMQDLYRGCGNIVPLSTTMAEQIKAIKRWAQTRAVKAS